MEKNQIPGFEPGSIRSANRFDLERYLEPKWLRYLLLHFHRLASLYLVTQKKNTKSNTIAKRLVKVLRKIPKATRLQNPQSKSLGKCQKQHDCKTLSQSPQGNAKSNTIAKPLAKLQTTKKRKNKSKELQEKSQQIVAQRLLSSLQYLDATKSSAKDLSQLLSNL